MLSKTAITMPFGMIEFKYTSQGLRYAAQTFQYFINGMLHGLNYAYNDILIASSTTPNEQKQHLREIFARLNKYGVRFNAAKYVLGVEKIEFLGCDVSEEGTLQEKVETHYGTFPNQQQ